MKYITSVLDQVWKKILQARIDYDKLYIQAHIENQERGKL
jgi:hypothetical protein